MLAMVIPVRILPGRSASTCHCTQCSGYETFPQGELLHIKHHNPIRALIGNNLRSKNLEVHQEVHCVTEGESNRTIIIAIKCRKDEAEIRFEDTPSQQHEVDREKQNIYQPTIPTSKELTRSVTSK